MKYFLILLSKFLKGFGIQHLTEDLVIPSIEMIMFGFFIGCITAIWTIKNEPSFNLKNGGNNQKIKSTERNISYEFSLKQEQEIKALQLTITKLKEIIQEKTDELASFQMQTRNIKQEIEKEDDIITVHENGNEYIHKENASTLRQSIPSSFLNKDLPYTLRQSRLTSSQLLFNSLNDMEKSVQYKKKTKDYKIQQKSDQQQIMLLKSEIKTLYSKLNNALFFEGKINSSKEFVNLFSIVFNDYKPTKKSKEAFLILQEYIMKSHIVS